ncbi:MAG TPA: ribonuclease HII [Devosia sp.]|nr:ribonuclease HII [Devosia sp.]
MVPASDSAALPRPDLRLERRAIRRGATVVAGVDEVGRGPLAGPVVVAAVILNRRRIPDGLNDSKLLPADVRTALYEEIMASATVSVVAAPTAIIAELNILHASLWAMRRAVLGLAQQPDHVLVDGNIVPSGLPCRGEAVVGGDGLSLSIAAASIVAKVTRDRMCEIMHCEEPHFGFDSHKGYSARSHFAALDLHGPGRFHRMDFAPCIEAAERRRGAASGPALPGPLLPAGTESESLDAPAWTGLGGGEKDHLSPVTSR